MIVCPNCQTENRLGSIFCRSCGSKLALDDLNVQNFEQKTGVVSKEKINKAKRKRKLIINIIRLAFLLAIAYGVYLVFQEPQMPKIDTSGKANESFKKKETAILDARKAGKEIEVAFTELEVNSFVAVVAIDSENTGKAKLKEIFIDLKEDNRVEIFLVTSIFGQRIVASCYGKVSAGESGLVFEPDGFFAAKMGKLPYPMFLFKYMTKNVLTKPNITDLLSAFSSIEITEGKADYKPSDVEKLTAEELKARKEDAKKGKVTVKVKK
jgi:hypothetical protein